MTPIQAQSSSTFTTPVLHQTTTYYVSLTTIFGCEGPRLAVVAEISMPLAAAITVSEDTLISNYSLGNQWYLNGVMIPGEDTQVYLARESGVYSVNVNIGSCSSSASAGYGDYQIPLVITAHPNPVTTTVTVQISGNVTTLSELPVLNTVGLQVATVVLYAEGGNLVGQIDMRNFPVGIYVVKARAAQSTELKLIKL